MRGVYSDPIKEAERRIRIIQKLKGRHHTEESKKKMGDSHKGKQIGKDNPMYGRNHTEETKIKIGLASIGRNTMLGKHHNKEAKIKMRMKKIGGHASYETKKKMSQMRQGEKHPYWKGGRKLWTRRAHAKRKEMGFIPINKEFKGSQGHHIDKENVLFIPSWLHEGIKHSILKPKVNKFGIIQMNIAAWMWYIFEGRWAQ